MEDSHPVTTFLAKFFPEYDEKLETEYILRARSIFEEYMCPETGTFLMCTFNELLNGISRLWTLAQEMKGFSGEIHERLINLPILFMIVLCRIIEKEYTNEEYEKSVADPQVGQVLLPLFHDMRQKFSQFRKLKTQAIIFNTCLLYLRHVLNLINADGQIKRLKWHELRVERCQIAVPFRPNDIKAITEALQHFRSNILPNYSKSAVKYRLTFVNRFPELMEPTRETQIEVANFLNMVSIMLLLFSFILFVVLQIIDPGASSSGGPGNFDSTY